MNDSVQPRVPRGHRTYVRVRRALPPRGADALGSLATRIRRVRLRLRLWRQRWLRRVRRSGRRFSRRMGNRLRRVRRRVRGFVRRRLVNRRPGVRLRLAARRFGPQVPMHANAADERVAPRGYSWTSKMMRALFPPALSLPGEGPTVAVDARGLSCAEVITQLAGLSARTIVIVDDPDIIELRSTGVYYEFAPSAPKVSADERLQWIVDAYGVDHVERMTSTGERVGVDG